MQFWSGNFFDEQITKFRIKQVRAFTDYNTLYQRIDGKLYLKEKNLISNSSIVGTKDSKIPVSVRGTQHVTSVQTNNVVPLTKSQINSRLEREIVEIY